MENIDFYITHVRYENGKISAVKLRGNTDYPHSQNEMFDGTLYFSSTMRVPREFIVELLKLIDEKDEQKINIYTAIKELSGYKTGEKVILYDNKFITTVSNRSRKDNLEDLPEF